MAIIWLYANYMRTMSQRYFAEKLERMLRVEACYSEHLV